MTAPLRFWLIWTALAIAIGIPLIASAFSPLLAWRSPVYIIAGLAGVIALALLLVQPLLAGGVLPGLAVLRARRIHRWIGAGLVLAVAVHVGALWITSPPDVIDALLLASPTPFSLWGVIAMWAVLATALLALLRRPFGLRPRSWRLAHATLALVIVGATIPHALLIDGTMEPVSKAALCLLVAVATLRTIAGLRLFRRSG